MFVCFLRGRGKFLLYLNVLGWGRRVWGVGNLVKGEGQVG